MIALVLGVGAVGLLLWAAQRFSSADVPGVRALWPWVAVLGGLSLVALLALGGRTGLAVAGLVLAGPLVWAWWKEAQGLRAGRSVATPMDRAEALQVLGLQDPVSDLDVREAWVKLMRTAHPDSGGTDWLASRVNQAKDVLLGRR